MTEQAKSQHPWHGHVRPREDGVKARCGGPALCEKCKLEQTLYGDKRTDEEKILYWMGRAKEAESANEQLKKDRDTAEASVVSLTAKLQEQQAILIELQPKAARYDWLRNGVKIRQGKVVPEIGTRMINKNEQNTAISFTRWVSQEKMDEMIDDYIILEADTTPARAQSE